ncbi:MAG: glycosyltransferase family 2 protein [Chitinophagaceae bacterium]|nr:glycosyltransferase family 2 protein [Chitinophagaceae bacterium]
MLEITCSIVLFRNPVEEVRKTIESFLSCTRNIKLYLVDNSGEDSLRYAFNYPRTEYIFTGRNLGFGAAHNLAIKKCIGKSNFHLILNPDIEFDMGTIEQIFQFMANRKEIGLVMPKVLYRSGDIQFLCRMLPAPADLIVRRFVPAPVKFLFKNLLDRYELKHRDYNSIMEIPNLCGCFMFVRTEVFETIGMFDEQYFLYFEDTDLCRRIHEQYRTVYYPKVSVIHGYARASYKDTKMLAHHLISSVRYFNKWGWFKDSRRILANNLLSQSSMALRHPARFTRVANNRSYISYKTDTPLSSVN